jgi:hypothetical protein
MASKTSNNPKIDGRGIASTLLQVSPIILVVTYIFEYSYVFEFLSVFDISPEEAGISEVKLLTRAAFLTVTVIWIGGILFAIVTGIIAIQVSVMEMSPVQMIPIGLRRARKSKRRKQDSIVANIRMASRKTDSNRETGALIFGLVFLIIILCMKPLGVQLSSFTKLSLFAGCIAISVTLYKCRKNKVIRYLIFACGAAIQISLLGIAVTTGGFNTAVTAASSGDVPNFINLLGVDISQVHPQWLDTKVMPPQYTQDQDLLELGSDSETMFLYDCKTTTTYMIPIDDVILTFQVYSSETGSQILQRLHCASTHA